MFRPVPSTRLKPSNATERFAARRWPYGACYGAILSSAEAMIRCRGHPLHQLIAGQPGAAVRIRATKSNARIQKPTIRTRHGAAPAAGVPAHGGRDLLVACGVAGVYVPAARGNRPP